MVRPRAVLLLARRLVLAAALAAAVVAVGLLAATWNDRAGFSRASAKGRLRRAVQMHYYDHVDANAWLDALDAAAPDAARAHRLVVVVPYRDRASELAQLLPALGQRLAADRVADWSVVVVNQTDGYRFNRGALLNAGVRWARDVCAADYVAINDVDRLPVDPAFRYRFPHHAFLHLSPWIMEDGYLPEFVGGSGLLSVAAYEEVDGHTNIFWGWGAEDAEFYNRLLFHGIPVVRPWVPRERWPGALAHFHDEAAHGRDYLEGGVPDPHRIHPTGLRTLRHRVVAETALAAAGVPYTLLDVALDCDVAVSPWCLRQNTTSTVGPIKYTAS